MTLVHNFLELPGPDVMASFVLKNIAGGNYADAIVQAVEASRRASENSFADASALVALALIKAGKPLAALEYWDRIILKSPQAFNWLEEGLKSAWACEADGGGAEDYWRKWISCMERVYIKPPPLRLLLACRAHGWQGMGSAGIHDGAIRGWLLLPHREKINISVNLPRQAAFAFPLKPLEATKDIILYSFEQILPDAPSAYIIDLCDMRGCRPAGAPVAVSPAKQRLKSAPGKKDAAVTILIPVYDDAVATLRCLGTVFASLKRNRARARIVVAWDRGPDENLLGRLRRLAERKKILMEENSINLGFLASVNQAMARFCQGDVIWLNSDTLVHGDWIDRLLAAAAGGDTATVTALGNEAEHMSFPSAFDRGKITSFSQLRILDGAARMLTPEEARIEIPAGIGFCMLITRRALERVGLLDGRHVFRGYGEEVDYCLRAAAAGLKNYGAYNVFVAHTGEKSFGLGKKSLAAQNNDAIKSRFPDYPSQYEQYLHLGRPADMRERISRKALERLPGLDCLEIRPWSARLLPPWQMEERETWKAGRAALFLRPGRHFAALLRVNAAVPLTDIKFASTGGLRSLKEILKATRFSRFESHGAPAAVLRLAGGIIDGPIGRVAPGADLPPPVMSGKNKVFLCAPPLDMAAWKSVRRHASANPLARIYIFKLAELWPFAIHEANIAALPEMADYSVLAPAGLLIPAGRGEADAWRQWLARHGCDGLDIYGTERA